MAALKTALRIRNTLVAGSSPASGTTLLYNKNKELNAAMSILNKFPCTLMHAKIWFMHDHY